MPDGTGITLAIAEADEELAMARLAFLAHGDHAALDAAIDACMARTERTLQTRWRTIGCLARSATRTSRPRNSQPPPAPAAPTATRVGPRELRGPEARRPTGASHH